MAAPSITITVTCGKAFIDSKKLPAATLNRITSSFFDFPSNMDLIAFKSAPAQNTPSLPRKVIPRTERSSRTDLKTLLKSSIISSERALRLSGRFNQIVSQSFERSNIRFFVCGRLVMISSSQLLHKIPLHAGNAKTIWLKGAISCLPTCFKKKAQ